MRMIKPYRKTKFLTWEEKALIDYIPGLKITEIKGNPFVIKSDEKAIVDIIINTYNCYALNFLKPHKTVSWCWDMCAMFMKHHSFLGRLWFKINCKAMTKSDMIIVGSENTKRDFLKYFKYPEEKIRPVLSGVDKKIYFPRKDRNQLRSEIKRKHKIKGNEKIILYVGS